MATFVGKFKGPQGFSQIPFGTAADQWEPGHTLAKALPASITRRRIGSIVLQRGHIQCWMCLFKYFLPAFFIYSGAKAERSAVEAFLHYQRREQKSFAERVRLCFAPSLGPKKRNQFFFFLFGINSSTRVWVSVLCRLSSACRSLPPPLFPRCFLSASERQLRAGGLSPVYFTRGLKRCWLKCDGGRTVFTAFSPSLVFVCCSGTPARLGQSDKMPVVLSFRCYLSMKEN